MIRNLPRFLPLIPALAAFKQRAAPAAPKLRETLKSDDLWLRVKAVEALNAIGEPAKVAVPEMLRMAAKGPTAEDPRGKEQRFVVISQFNPKGGLLGKSLDGVDRELLYEVSAPVCAMKTDTREVLFPAFMQTCL